MIRTGPDVPHISFPNAASFQNASCLGVRAIRTARTLLSVYIRCVYPERMSGTVRAKVFWSGGSQAIRVPKDLRLETLEVNVERRGKSLLISPVQDNEEWGAFAIGFCR